MKIKKIIISLVSLGLVLGLPLTSVPAAALNFIGESSSGTKAGTVSGSYAVESYEKAAGYRFSVVNEQNETKNVLDVYSSETVKAYGSDILTRKKILINGKLANKQTIAAYSDYKDLTLNIASNSGKTDVSIGLKGKNKLPMYPKKLKSWVSKDAIDIILKKMNYKDGLSSVSAGSIILAEPIWAVKIQGNIINATVSEIALFGAFCYGNIDATPTPSNTSGTFNVISKYTNREYPCSLFVNSFKNLPQVCSDGASSISSGTLSFRNIIKKGYGVGVIYGDGETAIKPQKVTLNYFRNSSEFNNGNGTAALTSTINPTVKYQLTDALSPRLNVNAWTFNGWMVNAGGKWAKLSSTGALTWGSSLDSGENYYIIKNKGYIPANFTTASVINVVGLWEYDALHVNYYINEDAYSKKLYSRSPKYYSGDDKTASWTTTKAENKPANLCSQNTFKNTYKFFISFSLDDLNSGTFKGWLIFDEAKNQYYYKISEGNYGWTSDISVAKENTIGSQGSEIDDFFSIDRFGTGTTIHCIAIWTPNEYKIKYHQEQDYSSDLFYFYNDDSSFSCYQPAYYDEYISLRPIQDMCSNSGVNIYNTISNNGNRIFKGWTKIRKFEKAPGSLEEKVYYWGYKTSGSAPCWVENEGELIDYVVLDNMEEVVNLASSANATVEMCAKWEDAPIYQARYHESGKTTQIEVLKNLDFITNTKFELQERYDTWNCDDDKYLEFYGWGVNSTTLNPSYKYGETACVNDDALIWKTETVGSRVYKYIDLYSIYANRIFEVRYLPNDVDFKQSYQESSNFDYTYENDYNNVGVSINGWAKSYFECNTMNAQLKKNRFSVDNKNFEGWSFYKPTGAPIHYKDESYVYYVNSLYDAASDGSVEGELKDIVYLYAQWKYKEFIVNYHGNPTKDNYYSSSKFKTTSTSDVTGACVRDMSVGYYGDSYTIANNCFSYSNYEFVCWSTSPKMGDGDRCFAENDEISINTNSPFEKNTLNLYAIWKAVPKPVEKYQIIYDGNDDYDANEERLNYVDDSYYKNNPLYEYFPSSGRAKNKIVYNAGEKGIVEKVNFTKKINDKIYVAKKWRANDGILYSPGESIVMNENKVLYAVWELTEVYNITYLEECQHCLQIGTVTPPDDIKIKDVDYEIAHNVPTSIFGHIFLCWYDISKPEEDSNNRYYPGGIYTENANLTLAPHYSFPDYPITYYSDIDCTNLPYPDSKHFEADAYISTSVPIATNNTNTTKFLYWQGSNGVKYNPNDLYDCESPLELFAVWGDCKLEILDAYFAEDKYGKEVVFDSHLVEGKTYYPVINVYNNSNAYVSNSYSYYKIKNSNIQTPLKALMMGFDPYSTRKFVLDPIKISSSELQKTDIYTSNELEFEFFVNYTEFSIKEDLSFYKKECSGLTSYSKKTLISISPPSALLINISQNGNVRNDFYSGELITTNLKEIRNNSSFDAYLPWSCLNNLNNSMFCYGGEFASDNPFNAYSALENVADIKYRYRNASSSLVSVTQSTMLLSWYAASEQISYEAPVVKNNINVYPINIIAETPYVLDKNNTRISTVTQGETYTAVIPYVMKTKYLAGGGFYIDAKYDMFVDGVDMAEEVFSSENKEINYKSCVYDSANQNYIYSYSITFVFTVNNKNIDTVRFKSSAYLPNLRGTASQTYYEQIETDNIKSCSLALLSSLDATFVTPNSPYVADADVISSFFITNRGSNLYTDISDQYCTLLIKCGEEVIVNTTLDFCVSAQEKTMVWFKWHVPKNVVGSVNIVLGFANVTVVYEAANADWPVVPQKKAQTPDTSFAKSTPGWFNSSASSSDFIYAYDTAVAHPNTTSWSYMSCSNGTFAKNTGTLSLAMKTNLIRPNGNISNGDLTKIKSGYGYTINYQYALESSGIISQNDYTAAQDVYCLFPEFNYDAATSTQSSLESGYTVQNYIINGGNINESSGFKQVPYEDGALINDTINNCEYGTFATLKETPDGKFIFPINATTLNDVHFTPIWMPNGEYSVSVVADQVWTPTGVLYSRSNSNKLTIDGNMYEDYHIAYYTVS